MKAIRGHEVPGISGLVFEEVRTPTTLAELQSR